MVDVPESGSVSNSNPCSGHRNRRQRRTVQAVLRHSPSHGRRATRRQEGVRRQDQVQNKSHELSINIGTDSHRCNVSMLHYIEKMGQFLLSLACILKYKGLRQLINQ